MKEKHISKSTNWILSNAFASLFKSYTQAINKQYNRTGSLFEEPFHRIEVGSDQYFTKMIYYIHSNPQKHGFIEDFRLYEHSSYQSYLLEKPTKLNREEVLQWFGGLKEYQKYHEELKDSIEINKSIIEF